MTYGVEVRLVPTATQVVSLGHAMAVSSEPVGMEVGAPHVEKLTVLSEVDLPPDATPTATHVVDVEQDSDERRLTLG